MLSFTTLGKVELRKDNIPLHQFRSQKEAALLIYLAHTGRAHEREFIATFLWDNRPKQQALANLRTALSRLRKLVGDALITTRGSVSLSAEAQQTIDSVTLLKTLSHSWRVDTAEEAQSLQHALDSYQGPFLADFEPLDARTFNEWVLETREHILRQVIAAYDMLGRYALTTGGTTYGIAVARRWLQVDALDETAHTLLIRLLIEQGNLSEATTQYERSIDLLKQELAIEIPAEMAALMQDIRPNRLPQDSPTPKPSATQHNLPAIFDQFIDRQIVQKEIHARLDQSWCRLLTIVGQGGVGKTRLATTIARRRLKKYEDGVWLVQLAEVDPDDDDLTEAIATEIATSLDLRLAGSAKPVEQLLNYLKYRKMLLVLDNIEHLLAGAQVVLDIIDDCENVQLLVTSREALRLRAEWAIPLAGLSYPAHDKDEAASDAVDLFVVRRAKQRWEPISAENMRAIRQITSMVEGLPLAIELAAALTHDATSREVAEQLRNSFDSLEASLIDIPQRHRNLHIVFDMSWHTLSHALQQRLTQLTIFRGGFTAIAAQQIAATDNGQLDALCDKSLLSYNEETDRYHLHAVVRSYAAAKHAATDSTQHNHVQYFLGLLAEHSKPLQQQTPQHSIAILQPDIDNLRSAWQAGLNDQQSDLLAGALTPLSIYYQLRGLARDGEAVMRLTVKTANKWGNDGIALATHAGLELARFQNRLGRYRPAMQTIKAALYLADRSGNQWAQGMGHVLWGESLWRLGEYDSAETNLTQALNIAHTIESTQLIGWSHHHIGIIKDIKGQHDHAHHHMQQACYAWEQIEHAQALSGSLNSIGLICYHQADLDGAKRAMKRAHQLCEQLNDRYRQSSLLSNLSAISFELGDFDKAQFYNQRALELSERNGNLANQGELHNNIGKIYAQLGNTKQAFVSLSEGLRISKSIGNRPVIAATLKNLADLEKIQGNLLRAESLFQQALTITQEDNLQIYECEILIGLAELFNGKNDAAATEFGDQALSIANSLKNPKLISDALTISRELETTMPK